MVKVVVGYKLKPGANIQPILLKLRSNAITYPGFINAENLMSVQDNSIVFVLYTWNKIEDWQIWERAHTRQMILQEAESILSEQPRVKVYRLFPTSGR